jgi:hypothetical protein
VVLTGNFTQEGKDESVLSFFRRPLEQFNVVQHGDTAFFFPFDQGSSTTVPPLNPGQDTGVKEHDIDLP